MDKTVEKLETKIASSEPTASAIESCILSELLRAESNLTFPQVLTLSIAVEKWQWYLAGIFLFVLSEQLKKERFRPLTQFYFESMER